MRLAALLAVSTLAAPGAASAADLMVGQTLACISSYPARTLFAVIGKIEPFGPKGTAVSITLLDRGQGAAMPEIAHVPIDLEALRASCPRSAESLPLSSNFAAGYAQWRQAADSGTGGVFSISVNQIEDILVAAVSRAPTNAGPTT